jgi:class 3 adenylate cyclase
MPGERGTRKLAAILAADAVGYSRMMSADEEGTLRVLAGHRAVIDRIIELHEGRIVGTAGDSVLAEFASPVLAVRCAVEMQEALKTRNQSLAPASQMLFRVGINLGDVVVAGDDLLGDGVNVAARLESIAEPGGICISSSVYDQISGKLNLGLQDIGEQNLKNISRPIRVYRIAGTGSPMRARPATHPRRRIGLGRVLGGLAVVVAIGLFAWRAGWLVPGTDREERAAAEMEAKRADAERARTAEELAQAKAAAEAAQRRAAEETAADAEARRALEAQRAAETKARAEAELARARADAEAMKRKAAAELAAAERTKADSERAAVASAGRSGLVVEAPAASVPVASNYDGVWSAARSCGAYKEMAPFSDTVPVNVARGEFLLERGTPGQPGYMLLRGTPDAGGSLALQGGAIAGHPSIRGRPIPASFEGQREGDRFVLKGDMGQRKCTLVITRTARAAVAATNTPSPYDDGNWVAARTCEAYMERPAIEDRLPVTVSRGEFVLERGESGEPGYLRIQGRPDADGTLVMSGNGVAGIPAIRGKKYPAFFEGHLEGGRFVMQGTLGRRSCALVIARAN